MGKLMSWNVFYGYCENVFNFFLCICFAVFCCCYCAYTFKDECLMIKKDFYIFNSREYHRAQEDWW